MKNGYKVGGFIALIAVVFAAAAGIGYAVGPVEKSAAPHTAGHGPAGAAEGATDMEPAGLSASRDGYTLELESNILAMGSAVPLRFKITNKAGKPVTDYGIEHEKELHLIVVRRDLSGFQHVHPTRDGGGTWSLPVNLPAAGDYRVFADFAPAGGAGLTLGTDVRVPGDYQPHSLPAPAAVSTVDGYEVTLSGDIKAGQSSKVTLSVAKGGRPITDLQPYLGAYGHLVALRANDLGYLHVHPDGMPGDRHTAAGPTINFYVNVPTSGKYRLYLDFRHDEQVRTAEFTIDVPVGSAVPTSSNAPAEVPHGGH